MGAADGSSAVIVIFGGAGEVVVGEVTARCDLALVDVLARLHLAARRVGAGMGLRDVTPPLRELLDLVGLADLLVADGSGVEVGGQPEGREELGVQEVVDRGDPSA